MGGDLSIIRGALELEGDKKCAEEILASDAPDETMVMLDATEGGGWYQQ